MKITVIDQSTNAIHEIAPEAPSRPIAADLSWFDPSTLDPSFTLSEDVDTATSTRIRFSDGREVEVDCKTGDLVAL